MEVYNNLKQYIEIDEIDSYPKKFIDVILKNEDNIKHIINSDIFETQIYKDKYINFKKDLEEILENQKFIGFHNTRIYNEEEYKSNGIRGLNYKEHLKRVERDLKDYGVESEIINELVLKIKSFLKPITNHKKGKIWLYSSISQREEFRKFTECYGGEIVEWSIKSESNNKFDFLREMGLAKEIKVFFYFDDLYSTNKDILLREMFLKVLNINIHKSKYKIKMDLILEKDIPSKNIIEIKDLY